MSSILIVGGGVAGLTCAWRLRRAGHDVEVLERESTPGGRMRSETHGDFVLERGAQFVASGYHNLNAMARVLGLQPKLRPLPRQAESVLHDGRLESADLFSPPALLRSRLLSSGAKLRFARLALELWLQRRIDPLRPERAAALDSEDGARLLARTVGREARDRLFAPLLRGTFDTEVEELSGAFVMQALRLALGSRLLTLEGGLGGFTAALADEVPLRPAAHVLSVETETHGARVRYRSGGRERSAVADAVVMAVPGPLVPQLCSKLTPTERGFFEGLHYARGAIVHLLLERPPQALPYSGVSFPRSAGLDLYALAVDHHKPGAAPDGAGLVNAALTQSAAARLWDAPDGEIARHVLEQLALTPVGRLAAAQAVVHRWPLMLPQPRPGGVPRLAAFLSRSDRSPRLSFAGDYLVGPYVEGALTSGMRAASEVARGLDAPIRSPLERGDSR